MSVRSGQSRRYRTGLLAALVITLPPRVSQAMAIDAEMHAGPEAEHADEGETPVGGEVPKGCF